MIILGIILAVSVVAGIVIYTDPRFEGIAMCNWPGTWGWTKADVPWARVFWLGLVGFVWRIA